MPEKRNKLHPLSRRSASVEEKWSLVLPSEDGGTKKEGGNVTGFSPLFFSSNEKIIPLKGMQKKASSATVYYVQA